MNIENRLPLFICGPLIRRLTPDRLVLWWVSPKPVFPVLKCFYTQDKAPFFSISLTGDALTVYKTGFRAFVHLADIRPDAPFVCDRKIEYDLVLTEGDKEKTVAGLMPDLVYPGQQRPSFVVRHKVRRFFHGSCRKPHHDSDDTFLGLDRDINDTLDDMDARPSFLMLHGDQIYADDVAGPMLQAIHRIVNLLGLHPEKFDAAPMPDSDALYTYPQPCYLRKQILPRTRVGKKWYRRGGIKHIFSSLYANNHMITFGEWMAMYFLIWSPALWPFVSFDPNRIPEAHRDLYEKERRIIERFAKDLGQVRRMLAHIPTYMIFDDHDITDDWNLTAQWEERAYGHPFTKRIIGNAMMAYFLCQGWGNAPQTFPRSFHETARDFFDQPDINAVSLTPTKSFKY